LRVEYYFREDANMTKRGVIKLELDGAVASDGRRQTDYQYGDVCATARKFLREKSPLRLASVEI
jgi:hypothetical protein